MLRKRMLVLLGGCFLLASAAWADEMGYVDCSNHPEGAQVYAKARKSPDVMGSVPCGERFTVLLYGFIFSRVQTGDGKVGYIFSNVISVDRGGAAAQRPAAAPAPAAASGPSSNATGTSTMAAVSSPATAMQPQPTPTQPVAAAATAQPAGTVSSFPDSTAVVAAVQPNPATAAQPQPTPAQPIAPAAPVQAAASASSSAEAATTTMQPDRPTSSQPQPSVPAPVANGYETVGATIQPASAAQPDPAASQPAASAMRPANVRSSWERPNPGGVRKAPLLELFGGYAFARLDGGGGSGTNLNGALGSVGWNIKSWLQLVADSSYSVVTISGTKNVLYGNHYGPRLFRRGRNRWGMTPFFEALVGGSRLDTTVSGVGGYKTSTNAISYKAGGGVDIHPSRHFEIRLFNVDYYRTSFGTGTQQNNYWASAGIVLRLFPGAGE